MIKLAEVLQDILTEKKLCKKGEEYRQKRMKPKSKGGGGEKSSAYLSGRALKVCKGLMEEDDLNEAKQVGTLYHNTSIKNAFNIIKDNKLTAFSWTNNAAVDFRTIRDNNFLITPFGPMIKDMSKHPPFISFTRTLKYSRTPEDVKIILDGDKLSQNYKIVPYSQFGTKEYDETEERIYKDITNLNKYIIKIILPNSNPEIESLLKEKNIPYELNLNESLRDWFKKEDWVRIDTAGNITGPCGTMKKGNKTTRCLPRAKANSLTKDERAATSKKKAASDKQFVPNTKKAKVKLTELRQIIYNIINESVTMFNENNIPQSSAQTFDLDGTLEKVLLTFNTAMGQALDNNWSGYDPHYFTIDSQGIITSDSAMDDLHTLLPNREGKSIVVNALKRIGYKVNSKDYFIKFIPTK